jgi:GGDEF domain-containing protein
VDGVARARHIAERIASVVAEPVRMNELSVDVTASIGIAIRESPDEDFSRSCGTPTGQCMRPNATQM